MNLLAIEKNMRYYSYSKNSKNEEKTMKKVLISIVIVALMLTIALSAFAGCTHELEELDVNDFEIIEMNIGKDMPAVEGATALKSDMTAFEMLETAVTNYYNADYAISQLLGSVATYIGPIKVTQMVDAAKIRSGKGDASGNNANGASYFADSISYSQFASLYEKIVITPDEIKYRNADTKYARRQDTVEVKEWNGIDTNFKDVADFTAKKSNNPTVLWMYDLQKDYVQKASDPIYDAETKTYRFAIIFDPEKSTVEYKKTMQQQLEGNAGMKVEGLEFKQLRLRVVLWENGMIRNMYITESYQMKLAGVIDSVITLNSDVQYSFNPNEAGYDIAENIASIDSNDKTYTKPYTEA